MRTDRPSTGTSILGNGVAYRETWQRWKLLVGLVGLLVTRSGAEPPPAFAPLAQERGEQGAFGESSPDGCPPFLSREWTLYGNADGAVFVRWTVLPTMSGDVTLRLVPSGGLTVSVPATDGEAVIDVLETEFDPFPPGYALAPGLPGTYVVVADALIGDQLCRDRVYIGALPPPTSVELDTSKPMTEGGRQYHLVFRQKFPLTVPSTVLFYIPSPRSLELFEYAGQQFSFWLGGTATVGEDFLAPAGNPYPGTSVTYPAHEQTQVVPLTVIDDSCPEPTESIEIYWIYAQDAYLGLSNLRWKLFGAPWRSWDILDNDAGKPPCPVSDPGAAS